MWTAEEEGDLLIFDIDVLKIFHWQSIFGIDVLKFFSLPVTEITIWPISTIVDFGHAAKWFIHIAYCRSELSAFVTNRKTTYITSFTTRRRHANLIETGH